jgi:hypothetical protein
MRPEISSFGQATASAPKSTRSDGRAADYVRAFRAAAPRSFTFQLSAKKTVVERLGWLLLTGGT